MTNPAAGGARFAVFGNATIEIVISVGGFPITYIPARSILGGLHIGVSGTAYSVGHALSWLGNRVSLCLPIGEDHITRWLDLSKGQTTEDRAVAEAARGSLRLDEAVARAVAIVGARDATSHGVRVATELGYGPGPRQSRVIMS